MINQNGVPAGPSWTLDPVSGCWLYGRLDSQVRERKRTEAIRKKDGNKVICNEGKTQKDENIGSRSG